MSRDTLGLPGQFDTIEQAQEARIVAIAAARRRQLLRWSSPVVALIALAAVFLLSITATVVLGERSFASQSYPSALKQFSWVQSVNVVQKWKPFYNAGTARYASGAFFTASQELEHALTIVPRGSDGERTAEECMVATNLSLAYEGLGDEAARANDPGMALTYYEQALAQLEGCGSGGGSDSEQQEQQQQGADEAQERQEQKQDEQQQEQDQQQGGDPTADPSADPSAEPTPGEGDPTPDPSAEPTPGEGDPTPDPSASPSPTPGDGEPSSSPTPTMSEQQRELEERNRDAQEQRERDEQEQGGGNGGGQGW